VSGIPVIDNKLVGKQDEMPYNMARKGNNTYYFLPLLLGLIGLIYYSRRDFKNSFVVFMLFLMTGWAIAFYLNNSAFQPRERDYAYAASFYAFSIWVGFGVFALIALLEKWKNKKGQVAASILITLICLGLVPGIMAKENWDDHDRSHRYTALAFAKAYLDSCEPNSIFFTLGDNETFPLWYAQEVEGYRTDVRVCNLSLLHGSWYVDQMKRKAYNSDPLPISMTWEQYRDGTRDQIALNVAGSQFLNVKDVVEYIKDPKFDKNRFIFLLPSNQGYLSHGTAVPASFSIPVDKEKVLANGTVRPEDADLIVDRITWNRSTKDINSIYKSNLILMDMLANFNWDRGLYFSISSGPEAYFGLEDYFQLEGMAYRLVPIKSQQGRGFREDGRVNTTTLPDKLLYDFPNHARVDVVNNPGRAQKPVYKYLWGGINDKRVYHPEETARMFSTMKRIYLRTAQQLAAEGNIEKAEQVHDKFLEIFNPDVIPYILIGNYVSSMYAVLQAEELLKLGTETATEKGLRMVDRMLDELIISFEWFEKGNQRTVAIQAENIENCLAFLSHIDRILSDEQRLLFDDKFEQIRATKTLTTLMSQISSEIDFYLKRGRDAQRELLDQFQKIGMFGDIAALTYDVTLQQNVLEMFQTKIKKISDTDPQLGRMFREYFLGDGQD
jgi:hypothetical protein